MENYCKKCEGRMVMHAFSDGRCLYCDTGISSSSTPCDIVCFDCSSEKEICMYCAVPL